MYEVRDERDDGFHMVLHTSHPGQVGVVHDIRLQELRLYTDYGRCCRPLFIVADQQLTIKKSHIERLQQREVTGYHWQNLIQDGLLE